MHNISISIVGLNGSGKSTVISRLNHWLQEKGENVHVISLYHSDVARNKILLKTSRYIRENRIIDCTSRQYDMLMASMGIKLAYEMRMQEVEEQDQIIIFDRYVESFMYEFEEYEFAKAVLESLPPCDLIIFMDCDIETTMQRIEVRGRKMRPDIEEFSYYFRDYLHKKMKNDTRCRFVDARQQRDDVFNDVVQVVEKFISDVRNGMRKNKDAI